jgi:hypothetical protein
MKYIIHPTQFGNVCLVTPTGILPVEEVARKDVPAGVPYLFVTVDQLPDDDFFDAWEADFSNPDGYGIGHEAWALQQEQAQ